MRSVYLVPTRGRPQNARRLADRWVKTTSPDTNLVFIVDTDDPELDGYTDMVHDSVVLFDERRRVGPTLNHWAPEFATYYDAVGFMGDDHLPQHDGWGEHLLARVSGTPNFITYGNDLLQGPNLPTAVLMDSRIIRTLGYMVPPGLTHLYLDNFWRDLGERLGTLSYHHDIIIEHIHPVAGKVAWDDRYREVNSGEMYGADAAAYSAYVASGQLNEAVRKLREATGA